MTKAAREALTHARRVVVKVGTRVLVAGNGRPDDARIESIVEQLVGLRRRGIEVILVSSGAIGAGLATLGRRSRPTELPELQMAAAVGQSQLMTLYSRLFWYHRVNIGQVLLTHDDIKDRVRHLNARNTMMRCLRNGVIPIVNENDVVSVDEIRFGDNDHLAALVAILVDADALLLLTRVNGLRAPLAGKGSRTRRIAHLSRVDDAAHALVWQGNDRLSTGGMESKLRSAGAAAKSGICVAIIDGRQDDAISRALSGADIGTMIGGKPREDLSSWKRWIGFFQRAEGCLVIDAKTEAALSRPGHSLLPNGVVEVSGDFSRGALVNVHTSQGERLARGLVTYGSAEIAAIKGKASSEIASILGGNAYGEVIHSDNLVILPQHARRITGQTHKVQR